MAAGAGLLFAYFTRLQSGIDKWQQLVAGFRAGLGALLDRVGALGGALVKVFTGDFSAKTNIVSLQLDPVALTARVRFLDGGTKTLFDHVY